MAPKIRVGGNPYGRTSSGSSSHRPSYGYHIAEAVGSTIPSFFSSSSSTTARPLTTSNTATTMSSSSTANDLGSGYSTTLIAVKERILADVSTFQSALLSTGNRKKKEMDMKMVTEREEADRLRACTISFGPAAGPPKASSSFTSSPGGSYTMDEDDICVSSVEFSLHCPYSQLPMSFPVRSRDCRHLQCCDVESWMILMSKCRSMRDPHGPCPYCQCRVAASSLELDVWMWMVMQRMPSGTQRVVLKPDGSISSGDCERALQQQQREFIDICETQRSVRLDEDGGATGSGPPSLVDMEESSLPLLGRDEDDPKRQRESETYGHPNRGRVKMEPMEEGYHTSSSSPLLLGETCESAMTTTSEAAPLLPPGMMGESPPLLPPPSPIGTAAAGGWCSGDGTPPPSVSSLSSQMRRLWTAHCPQCGLPVPSGGVTASATPLCGGCRWHGGLWDECHYVRRFHPDHRVSMERTPDGTLLLCGVDEAAEFLICGGFTRSSFMLAPPSTSSGSGGGGGGGVWVSAIAHSRVELDFLEACCDRIARGVSLVDFKDFSQRSIVPAIFRGPPKRRAGAPPGVTMGGTPPVNSYGNGTTTATATVWGGTSYFAP